MVKKLFNKIISLEQLRCFADELNLPDWKKMAKDNQDWIIKDTLRWLYFWFWIGIVPIAIFMILVVVLICIVLLFHIPVSNYVQIGVLSSIVTINSHTKYYYFAENWIVIGGIFLIYLIGWLAVWGVCIYFWRELALKWAIKKWKKNHK